MAGQVTEFGEILTFFLEIGLGVLCLFALLGSGLVLWKWLVALHDTVTSGGAEE